MLRRSIDCEVLVKILSEIPEELPETLTEKVAGGSLNAVWFDKGENPKWIATEERILNFPPFITVYVTNTFSGMIKTGRERMDKFLTDITLNAILN